MGDMAVWYEYIQHLFWEELQGMFLVDNWILEYNSDLWWSEFLAECRGGNGE